MLCPAVRVPGNGIASDPLGPTYGRRRGLSCASRAPRRDSALSAKYEPLRAALEAAPTEEPVSLSFVEIDRLVGGLPPSARLHRSWWGNTFSHGRPHALAWMSIGRRVAELRMGSAAVFSPADAPTTPTHEPDVAGLPPVSTSSTIPDGVDALTATLRLAGYATVSEAVAAHTVFLHPDTVSQTGGRALFRHVRDMALRDTIGPLADGTRVMFDDNDGPTRGFLWAANGQKGRDVQFNHIWGDPKSLASYTALWNLCLTPAFLAKTTDGSNHPEVVHLLRYRSLDLYGHMPQGEVRPDKPAGYDALVWPDPPPAVEDLEATLRQRLTSAPKSRPARSSRQLGWLFSDGPDTTLPEPS